MTEQYYEACAIKFEKQCPECKFFICNGAILPHPPACRDCHAYLPEEGHCRCAMDGTPHDTCPYFVPVENHR